MKRTIESLTGYSIGGTDGVIGSVGELYFDDMTWQIRYWVIDTGKWLPGRKVLIPPQVILGLDWKNKIIETSLTIHQIKNSPAPDADKPVSLQEESKSFGYSPNYWFLPAMNDEVGLTNQPGGDSLPNCHLRSSRALIGYQVQGRDNYLGTITDFIIEFDTQKLSHIVVDGRAWLHSNYLLIGVESVLRIEWATSSMTVELGKVEIKDFGRYNPCDGINVLMDGSYLDYHGRPAK